MKNKGLKNVLSRTCSLLLTGVIVGSSLLQSGSGMSFQTLTESIVMDENLTSGVTGSPDSSTYRILEIVPDESMASMGYFIGGEEPNLALVDALVNKETTSTLFNDNNGAFAPFSVGADDAAIYKEILTGTEVVGNTADGGWEKTAKALDMSTPITGYFQLASGTDGLYTIDESSFVTSVYPSFDATGVYDANIRTYYNTSAVATLGIDLTSGEYTGYNYDLSFIYDDTLISGYYTSNISFQSDGAYAIDEAATKQMYLLKSGITDSWDDALSAETGDDIGKLESGFETYMNTALNSKYNNIAFVLYDRDAVAAGTDGYYTVSGSIVRYNLAFGYQETESTTYEAFYVIDENTVTYNPTKGEFVAALNTNAGVSSTASDLEKYYTSNTTGTGEYNNYIIDFDVDCIAGASVASGTKTWVFVEGGTLPSGNPYSSETEATTMLGTQSFADNSIDGMRGYYTRNSFVNHEWFKLLMLRETSYSYDDTLSSYQNWVNAQADLAEYDSRVTITLISKTPDQVTYEDTQWADFITINSTFPFASSTNSTEFAEYGITLTTFEDSGKDFTSFEIAYAIICRAITEDVALLIDPNATLGLGLFDSGGSNVITLVALIQWFSDPANLIYFMADLREDTAQYKPIAWEWPCINSNGSIWVRNPWAPSYYFASSFTNEQITTALNISRDVQTISSFSQLEGVDQVLTVNPVTEITQNNVSMEWSSIFKKASGSWSETEGGSADGNPDDTIYFGSTTTDGANLWLNAARVDSIFTILQRENFLVNVTNDVVNLSGQSVIYVDYYDSLYNIYFELEGSQRGTGEPVVQSVEIYEGDSTSGTLLDYWYKDSGKTLPDVAASYKYSTGVGYFDGYPYDVKSEVLAAGDRQTFTIYATAENRSGDTLTSTETVTVIIRDGFSLN